MRSYKEQFEKSNIEKIDVVLHFLNNMRYPTGPAKFYAKDLSISLEAGALLSSLVTVSALMEIYIRGLHFKHQKSQSNKTDLVGLELKIENQRRVGFADFLDKLVKENLFKSPDAEQLKGLYKKIRIPVLHGLPVRLIQGGETMTDFDIFVAQLKDFEVPSNDFEDYIEKESIDLIVEIITLLCQNQYAFN